MRFCCSSKRKHLNKIKTKINHLHRKEIKTATCTKQKPTCSRFTLSCLHSSYCFAIHRLKLIHEHQSIVSFVLRCYYLNHESTKATQTRFCPWIIPAKNLRRLNHQKLRKHVCKLVHVQLTTSTQIPLFPGASQKDHKPWELDAFRLRILSGALAWRRWNFVRSARREEELYFSPPLVSSRKMPRSPRLAHNAPVIQAGAVVNSYAVISCFVQKVRFHPTILSYAVSWLPL